MARNGYRKLSGRTAVSLQQAYLGEDHLLVVEGAYRERVKRIDYEDIEAILICHTKSGGILSLFAGIGGLVLTLVTLSHWQEPTFPIWLGVTLITWLAFGVGVYGKGSALLGVQTAVQTVILAGANTRRKSAKAMTRLAERVMAVQGPVSPDDLESAHAKGRAAIWAARKPSRHRFQGKRKKKGPPPIQRSQPPPLRDGQTAETDR